MALNMIPQKQSELIWRSLDDGTVIIDPEQGDVRVLNEVGARVWDLVDGQRSVGQIAQEITLEFDVPLIDAHKDLQEYFEQMVDQGLIQWREPDVRD